MGHFCIFFFYSVTIIYCNIRIEYFYTVALKYQEHFSVIICMYCVFILMAWLFCLFTQQQLSDVRTIIFFCLPRCGLFPTIERMCFVTGDSDSLFSHGVMEWWKWRISIIPQNKHGKKAILSVLTEILFWIFWNVSVVYLDRKFPCDPTWASLALDLGAEVMQQYAHCI